jgi:hypothetical protein
MFLAPTNTALANRSSKEFAADVDTVTVDKPKCECRLRRMPDHGRYWTSKVLCLLPGSDPVSFSACRLFGFSVFPRKLEPTDAVGSVKKLTMTIYKTSGITTAVIILVCALCATPLNAKEGNAKHKDGDPFDQTGTVSKNEVDNCMQGDVKFLLHAGKETDRLSQSPAETSKSSATPSKAAAKSM